MVAIENSSPFPCELLSVPDTSGQEVRVLVSTCSWIQTDEGRWEPEQEQPPLALADEYFGDAGSTSLRYDAQVVTSKAKVDLLVNGSAYAPGGGAVTELVVQLEVGEFQKAVRVIGDRFSSALGPSSPDFFTTMPLRYERSYGGFDTSDIDPARHRAWRQNPVGVGFRGARSKVDGILTEVPNLEPIGSSAESKPAGFGAISRAWSPRSEYAGTFDQDWLDRQWPLLPEDFDPRHNQSAPADQQLDSLQLSAVIRMTNFTPGGFWEFQLPCNYLPLTLRFDGASKRLWQQVDTVVIEPDLKRVLLSFRLALSGTRRGKPLRQIVVESPINGPLL